MTIMKIRLLCLIVISNLLLACSNSSDINREGRKSVKDIYMAHQQNVRGIDVDKARLSWSKPILAHTRNLEFAGDTRLPNPELTMTVFPARNISGAVRPSYKMKFSMYEKVHYKIGY